MVSTTSTIVDNHETTTIVIIGTIRTIEMASTTIVIVDVVSTTSTLVDKCINHEPTTRVIVETI